jgi:hypothetical protein
MKRRTFLGALVAAPAVGMIPGARAVAAAGAWPLVGDVRAFIGAPLVQGGAVVGHRIEYHFWDGLGWRRIA